jgi:hypothetical protein
MVKGCLSAIGTMMSPGNLDAFAARRHMRIPEDFWVDITCCTMHSGAYASSTCCSRYVLTCIVLYCIVSACIDSVLACIGMYQYRLKTFKDPMHAYDHGVAIYIIQAIIKTLHRLETSIGLAKNTLVKKLTAEIHGLCNTLEVKHTTLMSFVHQSIVQCFENYSEAKTAKTDSRCPIVDATDVQKLMLTLPFLLDGLAVQEVEAFNAGKPQHQHVTDPLPDAIMAVNAWLHWYHLYRQPESDDDSSLPRLEEMGKELLNTLQTVFPFTVKLTGNTTATWSMWCNEKVHSIVHGSRNIRHVGRSKNISCNVTESKHRDIKAKGHMTNKKPGEYCHGIMRGEARESAAQLMVQDADERGIDTHNTSQYVPIQT